MERQAIQFVFDCLDEPDIVVGASPADLYGYMMLRENIQEQSEMLWRRALPSDDSKGKKSKKSKKQKAGKKARQGQTL